MTEIRTTGAGKRHPEWRLLLWAARPCVDSRAVEAMRALLSEDVDWDWTITTAEYHGVASLLERGLRDALPEAVPKKALRRLHLARHATEMQNRYLFDNLGRILRLCAVNRLAVVPVKGPVLAQSVYGSMALRSTRDLDLLVRRDDVLAIRDLFLEEGFSLIKPGADFGKRSDDFERFHELTFGRPTVGVYVETQWSISNDRFHSRLRVDELWEDLTSAQIDGDTVPCLPREDLLVMLCEHGTKHFWSRLKWTCDIAAIAEQPLNWNKVFDRAGSSGSTRAVLVGLTLCRDLLGSNLPGAVADRVSGDRTAAALSRWVARRLAAEKGNAFGFLGWKKCYFHARSREQLRDQLQHAGRFARFLVGPKQHGGALGPADVLLMPWRLILRIVRSARAHETSSVDRSRS